MSQINSFAFFLTCLLLISCSKNKEEVVVNDNIQKFEMFPFEQNVQFEQFHEYFAGVPKDLHIIDSTLVIFNNSRNSDYFFNNYSLSSNELSAGYVRAGKGPGEAYGVASTGIIQNKLWAYDITLKKILMIDKSQFLENTLSPRISEHRFKETYFRVDFLDSMTYLAVGSFHLNSKVSRILLETGERTQEFGAFLNLPNTIEKAAYLDAYVHGIYINPSKEKAVLSYRYTDVIEIFDLSDQSSVALMGPEGFDVEFNVATREGNYYMDKKRSTRKAFVNGAVTNNYIYLIFSGHTRAEDNWPYGKQIYVFDWDGHPIKRITLDSYVYCITVSPDDRILYSYDRSTGFLVRANMEL